MCACAVQGVVPSGRACAGAGECVVRVGRVCGVPVGRVCRVPIWRVCLCVCPFGSVRVRVPIWHVHCSCPHLGLCLCVCPCGICSGRVPIWDLRVRVPVCGTCSGRVGPLSVQDRHLIQLAPSSAMPLVYVYVCVLMWRCCRSRRQAALPSRC